MGATLKEQGKLDEALGIYKAISLKSDWQKPLQYGGCFRDQKVARGIDAYSNASQLIPV